MHTTIYWLNFYSYPYLQLQTFLLYFRDILVELKNFARLFVCFFFVRVLFVCFVVVGGGGGGGDGGGVLYQTSLIDCWC